MTSTLFKKIAATGAISGALSLAAIGLGAGAANADDGNTLFAPGGNGGDWQSYFPMIERLGDIANIVPLGSLGKNGGTESTGSLGKLGSLGNLGNLGSLGSLGNLGNGNWQDLVGLIGG
jgi:hypothetical protein